MNRRRFDRLHELFSRIVELPAADREAVLARECGGDREVLRRLRQMLAVDRASTHFDRVAVDPPDEPDPTEVGGHRILHRLGEGGAGRVYAAEQREPRRTVAIKVLHRLDEPARKRLREEAALLARLHHPHIAQIHAADTFGERPFLVMELVAGVRLDAWLAQHLPTRAVRVRLLRDVCTAVEHAHARGVVHRDLKPANVLVDDDGHIKVLDFGIAAAIESPLDEPAAGTLGYMSPEQLASGRSSNDRRVDVYAAGVLAFEVLSGRPPYRTDACTAADLARIAARGPVRALGELDRSLRGDLEAIVARAMATDPERRYPTMAALAHDLDRHLQHRPVAARPPRAGYLLARFARRHRYGLLAAAAMLAVAAATVALVRELREGANSAAVARRLMAGVLEAATVEACDRLANELDGAALRAPHEFGVRQALGSRYLTLDRLAAAADQLERAIALPPGTDRDAQRQRLQALRDLDWARTQQGMHDAAQSLRSVADATARELGDAQAAPAPATAEPRQRIDAARAAARRGEVERALRDLEALREELVGGLARDSVLRDELERAYADVLLGVGMLDTAEQGMLANLTRTASELGAGHIRALRAASDYAQALVRRGDFELARAVLTNAFQAADRAGNVHTHAACAIRLRLVEVAAHAFDLEQAALLQGEYVAALEQLPDPDPIQLLSARREHAGFLLFTERVDDATRLLEELVATDCGAEPRGAVERAAARCLLAAHLIATGRPDEAERQFVLADEDAPGPEGRKVRAKGNLYLRACGRTLPPPFDFTMEALRGRRNRRVPPTSPLDLVELRALLDAGHADVVAPALQRIVDRDLTFRGLTAYGQVLLGAARAQLGDVDGARAGADAAAATLATLPAPVPAVAAALAELRARL